MTLFWILVVALTVLAVAAALASRRTDSRTVAARTGM